MTKIRLTDIQLVLLASAAARYNGSLLPPPDTLGDGPARIRKVVEQLIHRGFAAETELPHGAEAWRTEDDRPIGVVITDEGRAAIGVEINGSLDQAGDDDGGDDTHDDGAETGEASPLPDAARARTKTAEVLAMLTRDQGATLNELVESTGWLPHTTRAALTGLRKKGHAIERGKRGDVTCYTLTMEIAA
jgi:hypothetical protein